MSRNVMPKDISSFNGSMLIPNNKGQLQSDKYYYYWCFS